MARNSSEHRNSGGRQSPDKRGGRKHRAKDSDMFKGLCANCAKRESCLLPECEGGVWHCEQYVEED